MKSARLYMTMLWGLAILVQAIPGRVLGQTVVQVVTKTIEKDITCDSYGSLRITGEKSEIEIHGWDKKNMHIKVQLISENTDLQQAKAELEYLHFTLNNQPHLVELSNTFIFPNWHITIHGNLKTRYEIWAPQQYIISIINKFGSINLANLQTRTMIDAEYSNITIDKYNGYLSVKSSYSDIKATDIHSDFECTADHADINLSTIGGQYHIEDKYGKISLNTETTADLINIRATWTPVTLITNGMNEYNYDVNTSYADILLHDKNYAPYKKSIGHRRTFEIKRGKIPEVSISTTYKDIDIK